MMAGRGLWIWRAWTAGRERIADCGIARADNAAGARDIALLCLGGPHVGAVVEIDVREVARELEQAVPS